MCVSESMKQQANTCSYGKLQLYHCVHVCDCMHQLSIDVETLDCVFPFELYKYEQYIHYVHMNVLQ